MKKINIGSDEPIEWTISHLAGRIRKIKESKKGFDESLKSRVKK